MNSAHISTLVRDLAHAFGLARDLYCDVFGNIAGRDTLSDVEHVLAIRRAFDLARSFDPARGDRVRDLNGCLSILSIASDSAFALERELHGDRLCGEGDRSRVRALRLLLLEAGASAEELLRDFKTRPDQQTGRVRPSVVSRRLTGWAARLLPVADRPEYTELFRSELYDLVLAGDGCWAQLGYALRVLVRAPLLRRELRAPAWERSW